MHQNSYYLQNRRTVLHEKRINLTLPSFVDKMKVKDELVNRTKESVRLIFSRLLDTVLFWC